ncbi:hypothetical protein [Streptomyces alfalfae]
MATNEGVGDVPYRAEEPSRTAEEDPLMPTISDVSAAVSEWLAPHGDTTRRLF